MDIFVENYCFGIMEKFGLGWDVFYNKFFCFIYVVVSGFGYIGLYVEKLVYDMVV